MTRYVWATAALMLACGSGDGSGSDAEGEGPSGSSEPATSADTTEAEATSSASESAEAETAMDDPSTADPTDPGSESEGSGDPTTQGGGDLPDCSFDDGLAWEPDGPVLQLESADASMCVRIERRNDGPGSLANTNWTYLDVRVGPLGAVSHVNEPADMCWYSSHHNFNDWAHAWTGTRHYDVKLKEDGHGGPRTYELHIFEQGPIGGGPCAPLAEGMSPIGDAIELFPYSP